MTYGSQRQAEAANAAMEQAQAGFPEIQKRWNDAVKILGSADELTLADGDVIQGRYVLTEANAPTASHNPSEGFAMTKGFPVDENGRTVNDRDYQNDISAQELVKRRASNYDQRALQTPVIVTRDGIVLSGNDRTMASQIAAANGTDTKYTEYLSKHPEKYGFTAGQVSQFNHPRVVFVPDIDMAYDTTTFARFNQSDTKTQNRTEQAVKAGKSIGEETLAQIAAIIDGYENINELYRDPKGIGRLLDLFVADKVITREQLPQLIDGQVLSGAGTDFIENILIGNILNEDALRVAMSDRGIRRSILSAMMPLVSNRSIRRGYSLMQELADAVLLLDRAKKSGMIRTGESVRLYMRQLNLFGENPLAEATVQLIADEINSTRPSALKNVMTLYNPEANLASQGQADIWSGDTRSKEELLSDILNQLGYDTRTVETKESRGAAAADEFPRNGQQNTTRETDDAVPGMSKNTAVEVRPLVGENVVDFAGRIANAAKVRRASSEVDTNPTDKQKEAGNYRKGHVRLDGLDITIENPKGSVRTGTDTKGNKWETVMHNTYGYIRGTLGNDGDHIDVFIADNPVEGSYYIIDQVNPDGSFDEHKVMYGFASEQDAKDAYLANYTPGWTGLGNITGISSDGFKRWLESSSRKIKKFAEYKEAGQFNQSRHGEVNASSKDTGRKDVRSGMRVNPGVSLSDFASAVSEKVYDRLPDSLRESISVRSSSTGDEVGENFIQRYDIDGNPAKVYFISFIDAPINADSDAFAISDYNASHQDIFDEYSHLFFEYMQNHTDIHAFESDEAGALFDSFEDALDFSRYADGRMANSNTRFLRGEDALNNSNFTNEEKEIIRKSAADNTYMKAPNGADSNLSPKQWVQVRTKAFKEWFGDWEKTARIEKLRKSVPVEITGNEIEPSDDLKQYKKNALEYGKKLRGEYRNSDTGEIISVNAQGIKEVLHHDYKNKEQLQSVAAIPLIIENGIYIDTVENESPETNSKVKEYRYYVCGLRIGDEDYTVKAAVAVDNNGRRYYDHSLTRIEKTKLLDELDRITSPSSHQAVDSETSAQLGNISDIKDKRLLSLLQTNSSKVVDENGEPKVVYHGTNADFTIFSMKMSGSKGDPGLRGKGFYLSPNRRTSENYGNNIIASFVNIKNPFDPFAFTSAEDIAGRLNVSESIFDFTPSSDFRVYGSFSGTFSGALEDAGYDGVLYLPRQEIVAFNPNQIKSATDNTGAFSEQNDDIRYRRVESEAENQLVAVHNLSEDKLKKAFELGGFPMPSIAVTKADVGHTKFGDISLIFNKESINPTDKRNKVYGEDAWTPTFPAIGYKLNDDKTRDIYSRANRTKDLPFSRPAAFHPDYLETKIDGGIESLVRNFKDDYGAKQFYLSETGTPVEQFEKVEANKYSDERIALYEKILREIGLERLKNDSYESLENDMKRIIGQHEGVDFDNIKPHRVRIKIDNARRRAADYAENGNKEFKSDIEATQKKIDERIDQKEFEKWLEGLFDGLVEKKGIKNTRNWFTPSGTSRKWEELYDEITLDNVVKLMQGQAKRGGEGLFGGSIFGASQKEYNSIEDIREAAKRRIRSMDSAEYDNMRKDIQNRLLEIKIQGVGANFSDVMDMEENIKNAVANSHTPKGIYKYLKEFYPNVTMKNANEIAGIVKDIQDMSARYFEAKPYRAVGLNEVMLAVVPDNVDKDVIDGLRQRNIPVEIYEGGNEEQRRQIVKDASLAAGLLFRRAYHGSAADFDKFDHSFMGTGEGAQAYGWGTYVTEVDGIARSYAEDNASGNMFKSGFGDFYLKKLREAITADRSFDTEKKKLLDFHAEMYESTEKDPNAYSDFRYDYELLSRLQESDMPHRNLYTVEIPEDNGTNYLDWTQDLTEEEESDIIDRLSSVNNDSFDYDYFSEKLEQYEDTYNLTGEGLYKLLSQYGFDNNAQEASMLLHDIGFTGIKYPAQYRSGGRADNAKNYVIFNENDVQITDHTRFRGTEQNIREVSEAFNKQLDIWKSGNMKANERFILGLPNGAMQLFVPDMPIVMRQTVLRKSSKKHNLSADDLKNLPEALSNPVFVFQRSEDTLGVLTELKSKDGKNVFVAIGMSVDMRNGNDILSINDILSVHERETDNIILPIVENNTLKWVDKEKGLNWLSSAKSNLQEIDSQTLSSATNIVENFENPKFPARNPLQAAMKAIREDRLIRQDNSQVKQPMSGTPQNIRAAAEKTARALGVDVNFITRDEMPEDSNGVQQRYAKGYQRAGRIYVCLENHSSEEDVIKTAMHEIVGHKGLRALVGPQNMDRFCMAVFNNAAPEVRNEILTLSFRHNMRIGEAVEEYLAGLAEKGEFTQDERLFFRKVIDALMELLDRIGIHLNRPFSVSDAKYLLWQSYHALEGNDFFIQSRRAALADRLGFGRAEQERNVRLEDETRLRRAEDAELTSGEGSYRQAVTDIWSRMKETYVDMYAPLESLVKAVEKSSGKKAAVWENPMSHVYRTSSVNYSDKETFLAEFMKPMWDAVKAVARKSGKSIDDMVRYVILKHGLERNEKFAKRDAVEHYKALRNAAVASAKRKFNNYDGPDVNTARSEMEASIAAADRELSTKMQSIASGNDAIYLKNKRQDYSGIISMFSRYEWEEGESAEMMKHETRYEYNERCRKARKPMYGTLAEAEAAAKDEIDLIESTAGEECIGLWSRINAANDYVLRHQFDAGMISKETYDRIRGMFDNYVPLRGFEEDTAEDLYEYYNRSAHNDFSPPLAKAKGRNSVADNPFAQIGVMAESAIQADNKNRTKLSLYYFVAGRPGNGLVTLSKVWYELQGIDEDGKKVWKEVAPDFSGITAESSAGEIQAAISMFDQHMEELRKKGLAFSGNRKLDLGERVVHINDRSMQEHIIRVSVNGEKRNMIVNGNPRAAQALNGLLNIETDDEIIQNAIAKLTRWMSANFTARNPEFWITNLQRDLMFSVMSVDIKEDPDYSRKFRHNLSKGFRTVVYSMKRGNDNLGNSRYENMYREFVENGGVTGYTRLASADEYKDMMTNYLKRDEHIWLARGIQTGLDKLRNFSEGIENIARFTAYITSRESGRSIVDSIMDAKNISVNFNRKGSGKPISWKESGNLEINGLVWDREKHRYYRQVRPLNIAERIFAITVSGLSPVLRSTVAFFNASVQALSLQISIAKRNPARFTAWMSGYFALGMVNAMLHAILDDDDDYLDIPDWERRNNILIGGNGIYLKWAVPQEARPFYAMGDIIVNMSLDRTRHQNVFLEATRSFLEVAPPVVPTSLQPVVELAMNRDYMGAPIYRAMPWDEQKPAYQNVYRGTSWVLVDISEILNTVSGGDYATPGRIGKGILANPAVWEHVIEGITGGTGQFINKCMQSPKALWDVIVDGEEWIWRDTPLLNRIIINNDDRTRNSYLNEIYWYYKDISDLAGSRERAYRNAHDTEKLLALRTSSEYAIMRIFQKYKKRLEKYDDLLKEETDEYRRRDIMRDKDEYVLRPMTDELLAADR